MIDELITLLLKVTGISHLLSYSSYEVFVTKLPERGGSVVNIIALSIHFPQAHTHK